MSYFKRKSDFYASEKKRPKVVYSEPGTEFEPTYEYQYVEGIKMLVPTGETNVDEYIQSFKESQDIHTLISKFLVGDIDNRPGTFGDFRDVPSTYAELFQRVNDCRLSFDQLPLDIRNEFDNSYEKFWSEYGSDRFNSVFNAYFEKQSPVASDQTESEVVTDAK